MDVLKLLLTFLLTTVAGGALGYYFQTRSWRQQSKTRQLESERTMATQVFEEISRLMDKRLYRMRQIFWRLRRVETTELVVEKHLSLYRELLYEWNDNLNRNLALVQACFGRAIRRDLELYAYEAFREIGDRLEQCCRDRAARQDAEQELDSLEREIRALGVLVYNVNLKMIRLIQRGTVGVFSPDVDELDAPSGEAFQSTR